MSAGHVRHKSTDAGVSPEDRRDVLEALAKFHRALIGRVNQGDIIRRTGATPTSTSNAIDALVLTGLVDEYRVERSTRHLWLTDAGWDEIGGKKKWSIWT